MTRRSSHFVPHTERRAEPIDRRTIDQPIGQSCGKPETTLRVPCGNAGSIAPLKGGYTASRNATPPSGTYLRERAGTCGNPNPQLPAVRIQLFYEPIEWDLCAELTAALCLVVSLFSLGLLWVLGS